MFHPIEDFHKYIQPGKRVHLAGIGGVSMCPLAEVLRGMGLQVQGSDMSDGPSVQRLKSLGIPVSQGHSAENLGRMFATPLLEPYEHLFYVLYGGGGNGKGILLDTLHRSLPELSAAVTSKTLLGGRNGNGGFATDQETLKLIGALWAYDEDADTITLEQATLLKKIGTGDTMVARRVQENAVSFKNKATFIIASNNPVIMSMTEALERRRVFVRMRDGRAEEEFADLLKFRDEHGIAPFLMASCRLWEVRGDKPWNDVVIGSDDDLTEAQQWIVDHTDREVAEAIIDQFPDTDLDTLEAVTARHRQIDAWNAGPMMARSALERLETVMTEAGELEKDQWVDFDKLVDNSFAQKAMEAQ